MSTREVIEKYFKDGAHTMYFHSSDAHHATEGDTYLRYEKTGTIDLWIGGNSGEFCLVCTTSGAKLEQVIKAIIYP